uniref:Transmembrane protein n=1 Tax=Eutreptiella gymnastica TaxID=73025 RepID=A0A7S4LPG3_9EUGL|mmetsp:Transcript_84611/g.141478  ORF Transcript_84611/g.141478 Transcript_84611/m.141478 type:complete len:367 (+) Transcript_84611:59-1159(+)
MSAMDPALLPAPSRSTRQVHLFVACGVAVAILGVTSLSVRPRPTMSQHFTTTALAPAPVAASATLSSSTPKLLKTSMASARAALVGQSAVSDVVSSVPSAASELQGGVTTMQVTLFTGFALMSALAWRLASWIFKGTRYSEGTKLLNITVEGTKGATGTAQLQKQQHMYRAEGWAMAATGSQQPEDKDSTIPPSWLAKSTSKTEGWVGGEEDLKGRLGEPSPAEPLTAEAQAAAEEAAKEVEEGASEEVLRGVIFAFDRKATTDPEAAAGAPGFASWLAKSTSTTEGWPGGEEDLKGAPGQPTPAEAAERARLQEAERLLAEAEKKARKEKPALPQLTLEESQQRAAKLLRVLGEAQRNGRSNGQS